MKEPYTEFCMVFSLSNWTYWTNAIEFCKLLFFSYISLTLPRLALLQLYPALFIIIR